ncbi:MAG: FRG domain-containing protein [Methylobacter sp.]|nr:FRG domain-containing protein [Methylobacter sp.]
MNTINWFDKTFDEAKKVIDYFLSDDMFRTSDRFTAAITGKAGYIFRGQSNSDWPLLPSAFRPETDWPKFTPQPPEYIAAKHDIESAKRWLLKHLHAEAMAINIFLNNADAMGITTPIDYALEKRGFDLIFGAIKKALNKKKEVDFDDVFPTNDFLRTKALAQHHGVPTRFTDWSESPLVACYFAAEQASSISNASCSCPKSDVNQIAIYHFNIMPIKDDSPIEIIKAPRHENSNLLNQKGVFVDFKKANSYFLKHYKWPDLYNDYPEIQIHRALLPANKADDMLRLLFDLGITRHSLSPNLANAAKAYEYMHKLFPNRYHG